MIVTWHAVRQFDKDRVDSKEDFFIAQRAGTWKGNRLAHNYVVLRSGCGKSREYSDECSVRLDPWLKGKPEVFNSSKAHDGFEWNWITDRVGFSNLDAKALKGEVQPKMVVSGRLRTVGRDGKSQVVKKDHLGKADRKNPVPWKVVLPEEVRSEERVRQILRSTDWKEFDKEFDKESPDIQDLILDRDPDLKRAYERRKEGMDRNGKK